MKQLNVYPECYVDTNLVAYILGKDVKHKSSCNEVVKALNNSEEFAVGIIDADKRMPTFDSGFVKYGADGALGHLSLFIHNDGKRFLFTVKPAMDRFIMDAAEGCGVSLREFGFPITLSGFKKVTKSIMAADDAGLRRLFSAISGFEELQRFRNTLKYLTAKQYLVNVSVVKEFFDGELKATDLCRYIL